MCAHQLFDSINFADLLILNRNENWHGAGACSSDHRVTAALMDMTLTPRCSLEPSLMLICVKIPIAVRHLF